MMTMNERTELPLDIVLDRSSALPLYRQIYRQIRGLVLEGYLMPGTFLPPSRVLAEQIGCSRATVVNAYEQLESEGCLDSHVGSGTTISSWVRHNGTDHQASETDRQHIQYSPVRLSRRGKIYADFKLRQPAGFPGLLPGEPDVSEFPFSVWTRLFKRIWLNPNDELRHHHDPAGYLPLRQAIATHLATYRGIICEPEEIIITSGATQSLDFITRCIIDPGDSVWVEDPGHTNIPAIFSGVGARVVPVSVDQQGLNVAHGIAQARHAKLAFTIPSHQFPLGVTLSPERRTQLLNWARHTGAYIVENDFNNEYRYNGQVVNPLLTPEDKDKVIYVGSFSKFLCSALRLGFLVAPKQLASNIRNCRLAIDYHPAILEQPVLAAFINEGYFARYIRRMRKIYKQRRDKLIKLVREHTGDLLEIQQNDSGMHMVFYLSPRLKAVTTDMNIIKEAERQGLALRALSEYFICEPKAQGLLIGYTFCDEEAMEKAISLLASILMKY